MKRSLAGTALLLGSSAATASASGPDGLLTLVVGLPLMMASSSVLGLLLIGRRYRAIRVIAAVLFVPTFFYSLYVALDAITLFKEIGSENSMIGFTFFGLLALSCLFFFLIVRRVPLRADVEAADRR